jgi:hypothetical protein
MSITAIPPLVALTSTLTHNEISPSELAHVAGALQKQVTRDLAPSWHLPATVVSQPDPKKVPHGYWPITVMGQIDAPGALGYHSDEHNQPFSVVQFDRDWPITCSHEVLEMLGDPFGSRMIVGDSPIREQGRVQYLLELCDPCEAFVYNVDGVRVSDFLLPRYHQPFSREQTPYSFTGRLRHAREVAPGGYLSWYVPKTREWWQRTYFQGNRPADKRLGRVDEIQHSGETPREMIDRVTIHNNQFGYIDVE